MNNNTNVPLRYLDTGEMLAITGRLLDHDRTLLTTLPEVHVLLAAIPQVQTRAAPDGYPAALGHAGPQSKPNANDNPLEWQGPGRRCPDCPNPDNCPTRTAHPDSTP